MAYKFKEKKKLTAKSKKAGKKIGIVDRLIANHENLARDLELIRGNMNNLNCKVDEINRISNLVKAHTRAIMHEREYHENISKEVDMRSQEVAEMHSNFSSAIADVNSLKSQINSINYIVNSMNNSVNTLPQIEQELADLRKEIELLKKDINLLNSKETLIID